LGGIEVEGDAREPITGHFERLGHGNACRARLERIEVHSALSIDDSSDVREPDGSECRRIALNEREERRGQPYPGAWRPP
jgi:hypothetical protein